MLQIKHACITKKTFLESHGYRTENGFGVKQGSVLKPAQMGSEAFRFENVVVFSLLVVAFFIST